MALKFIYVMFAQKIFYRAKRVSMSLQQEIWEGAVSLPMRSRGWSSRETWKFRKSHFQILERSS